MKTTGMIRRVDGLGRIVIPKEIRRVLKIKENEQVEINVSGSEIVLNKYSELDQGDLFLKNLLDIISNVYNVDILLTNLNNFKIVCKKYEFLKNKEISSYLTNILDERKDVLEKEPIELLLCNNEAKVITSFCLKTLIINGDSVGLIIFLTNNIFNLDNKLVEFVNSYLEKYLE